MSTKTQSRRGPGMSPLGQKGVERITSQYIPPGPDGLLGAQNIATAEWWTDTFESHIIGHAVSASWSGSTIDVGSS